MEALYAAVAAEQLDKAEANRIADESRGLGLLPMRAEQAGRKGPWLLELAGIHHCSRRARARTRCRST